MAVALSFPQRLGMEREMLLRHRARHPPALRRRVRPPVHLHPEERALDPPRIPLYGKLVITFTQPATLCRSLTYK